MENKTKIVATIGPASGSREMLRQMMLSGLDVARLNFSHGDYATFAQWIKDIRELSAELKRPVAILQDLQGPKIRVGEMKEGVIITAGQRAILTTKKVKGTAELIPIQYPALPKDVKEGDVIFMDDGLLEVKVVKTNKKDTVEVQVITGGPLSSHKGLNLPKTDISTPGLSAKDLKDVEFGLEQDVDYIALSFVRSPKDVKKLKGIVKKAGKRAKVIPKIERREAVEFLEEIIAEADGVMVARGDLGIEVSLEEVPLLQKKIINMANAQGKPVITATQMLDSMIRNPKPTRAEVTDVANAILDGTDAVMLSGESAVGKYPLESVKMLASIASEVEKAKYWRYRIVKSSLLERVRERNADVTEAIAIAAQDLAEHIDAKYILTATMTGYTALMLAKQRPKTPILAYSPDQKTIAQLALVYGVYPQYMDSYYEEEELLEQALDCAIECGYVRAGDKVVLTAGTPTRIPGQTDLLKVHVVEKDNYLRARL